MTVFENDYLRKFLLRETRADLSLDVARAVEPDSIVFTSTQISFYRSSGLDFGGRGMMSLRRTQPKE